MVFSIHLLYGPTIHQYFFVVAGINIFGSIIGKIQENMLKVDIQQVQDYGDTFLVQLIQLTSYL